MEWRRCKRLADLHGSERTKMAHFTKTFRPVTEQSMQAGRTRDTSRLVSLQPERVRWPRRNLSAAIMQLLCFKDVARDRRIAHVRVRRLGSKLSPPSRAR